MPPESIEQKKTRRKRAALWSGGLYALFQLAVAVLLSALANLSDTPGWLRVICLLLAGLSVAAILPLPMLLKKRFKEIEGGELDAAAEY